MRSRVCCVESRAREGVVLVRGLIFQGCHYELPDIKFVSVDLPAVTVETPSHPRGIELSVALRSLLARGSVYRGRLMNVYTPSCAPIKFSLSDRRAGKIIAGQPRRGYYYPAV